MTNLDLKELWASQQVAQPDLADILGRIERYKKASRRQTLFTNVTLGATGLFILFVWYYYEPQLLTTKLGIVLTVSAIAFQLTTVNRISSLFKKSDESVDNQHYLENLRAIKARQQVMHTTFTNIYFLLLSVGIALYMFEYTSRMETVWAVTTYAITGAWILFNWLFFRPRIIRKQQGKINELIAKLEGIKGQLKL